MSIRTYLIGGAIGAIFGLGLAFVLGQGTLLKADLVVHAVDVSLAPVLNARLPAEDSLQVVGRRVEQLNPLLNGSIGQADFNCNNGASPYFLVAPQSYSVRVTTSTSPAVDGARYATECAEAGAQLIEEIERDPDSSGGGLRVVAVGKAYEISSEDSDLLPMSWAALIGFLVGAAIYPELAATHRAKTGT